MEPNALFRVAREDCCDARAQTKAWDELIGALIEICEPLRKRTAAIPVEHVPVRIIDGLFLQR
jgi:hypothetical protein